MNIEHIDIEVSNSQLTSNLLLYRNIKDIIQSKISKPHILKLIEVLNLILQSKDNFDEKKLALTNSLLKISSKEHIQERLLSLIEHSILEDRHFNIFRLSLNILRFKDYILEKSKLYAENFRVLDKLHIMDFQYDQNMLNLPYAVRVSGALLIRVLFADIRLKRKREFYATLINDIEVIQDIDPEIILQIIFAESSSQAIHSLSGSSYEKRFEQVLLSQNLKYEGQCFDTNLPSVEYDFKIHLEDKSIGVSAKRTLRERYKQNHESLEKLEVDAMILVTLGIDLNKAKIDYILAKEKHYIFVASDLYEELDYFNQNKRVFPLNKLNKELLLSLIGSSI